MKSQSSLADTNMRDQLLRLMMSALDFRHALSAATFLLEDCDWSQTYRTEDLRRFRCYETTMVVAYGRPFAQARGHTAPFSWKLLKPGFQLRPDETALHEKLLDCRNKLHAHSDGDFTKIVPQIWRSELPNGSHHDFLAILGGERLVFAEAEVRSIHTFLWKVRHYVDKAVQSHPAPRDGIPVVITDLLGQAD
jgi:hypothetical protein